MLYFRSNNDYYDYFTGYSIVKGELLTERERCTKARTLSDECFDTVKISTKNTFKNFDVRFPCSKAVIILPNKTGDVMPKFFEIDNVKFCFSISSFYKRNEYGAKYSLSRYDKYLGWIVFDYPRNYTSALSSAYQWLLYS